ncbi:MAG: hypothetical protein ABWW70_08020 [Thermoproteota archaeon]
MPPFKVYATSSKPKTSYSPIHPSEASSREEAEKVCIALYSYLDYPYVALMAIVREGVPAEYMRCITALKAYDKLRSLPAKFEQKAPDKA